MTDFSGLNLIRPLMQAIESEGYTTPTPIQSKSIPYLLQGRDLLGVAQTGTGKTAAFVLPMLQRLAESQTPAVRQSPRALILAPTRELAGQIREAIGTYGRNMKLRHAAVFGGVSFGPQIKALSSPLDILVATPGRLLDLMNQNRVRFDKVEIFVLDEADRMLDMGFITDVTKIASRIPKERQTLMFSATMPKSVSALAAGLLTDPVRVEVAPESTTAERVRQSVLFVTKDKKRPLLQELLGNGDMSRVLVFTRTKHGADKVARLLDQAGIVAGAIHGNKSQSQREKALKSFRAGRIRALVATDIAARGIDVDGVTHVINYELPNDPECYVHRIGRTARAGTSGVAISFCDAEERPLLRDIEKVIRQSVPVFDDHPYHDADIANFRGAAPGASRGPRQGRGPRPSGQKFNRRRGKSFGGGRPSARAA